MKTILLFSYWGLATHSVAGKSGESQASCEQSEAQEKKKAVGKCRSPLQNVSQGIFGSNSHYTHSFLNYVGLKLVNFRIACSAAYWLGYLWPFTVITSSQMCQTALLSCCLMRISCKNGQMVLKTQKFPKWWLSLKVI